MYGDTDVIRRHVGRLREQAGDVRAVADQLVAQVEAITWTGRAGQALSERVRERAARLRDVAARHEVAADSLAAHGDEVDELKEAITDVERRAEVRVTDARIRAAQVTTPEVVGRAGGGSGEDPADEAWLGFEPPPSGHRDWLTVSLPGL